MGAPTPQVLLEAIANSAPSGTSPGNKTAPMPDSPPGSNFASIQAGFPANTMQSELAGGLPPFGQDMNGYLFLISSHTLYVECGQLYQYNSTLATAISGYLAGTVLGMADGTGMWLCTTNGTTSNPDTGGAGWVPIAAYGKTTVPVTGGTVVLSAAQSKYGVIILTGTLLGNLVVQLPQTIQEWLIINNTTGAFTTVVNTAAVGSAGVIVQQGGFGAPLGVYSVGDGNIYPTVAPFSFNVSVAPSPNSIVQRNNAGYVLATYFNTSAPIDNLTPSSVFTNSGDGFIRQNTLTNFESFLLLQGLGGQVTNGQVPYSVVQQWASTFFNNAALTGNSTAPTAAPGTNNTQIATTAFVQALAGGTLTFGSGILAAKLAGGLVVQAGEVNAFSGNGSVTFGVTAGTIAFSNRLVAVAVINVASGAVQTWLGSAISTQSFSFSTTNGAGTSTNYFIAVGF